MSSRAPLFVLFSTDAVAAISSSVTSRLPSRRLRPSSSLLGSHTHGDYHRHNHGRRRVRRRCSKCPDSILTMVLLLSSRCNILETTGHAPLHVVGGYGKCQWRTVSSVCELLASSECNRALVFRARTIPRRGLDDLNSSLCLVYCGAYRMSCTAQVFHIHESNSVQCKQQHFI